MPAKGEKKAYCLNGHPRTPENVRGSNCLLCLAKWHKDNPKGKRSPEPRKAAPISKVAKPDELDRLEAIRKRRIDLKREALALTEERVTILKRLYQRVKRRTISPA